ncbi:MAG: hypothetical protein J6T01_00415 [Kiritimatiellae bacterium]|nr:hypothetical protein [Kiritimatiellia bacterium]
MKKFLTSLSLAVSFAAAIVPRTHAGIPAGGLPPVDLPDQCRNRPCEVWLCAGQSNMQKGWDEFRATPAEKSRAAAELAQLDKVEIWLWDVAGGGWSRLTPANGGGRSAFGVSFAIRRALKAKKPVAILHVAAGGAPAESFLSRRMMCKTDAQGRPVYPKLRAIAMNPRELDANDDFPCSWCRREYRRLKEACWWPVSRLYERGIRRIEHLPLTGVLWYQGESNATTCVEPDTPLADDYMLETNLAVIDQLRGGRSIPFVMMGLPKMSRPWQPYRAAQKKACAVKGAIFADAFAAGLGDPLDVHPRDKIPFAELAIKALDVSAR